MAYPPAGPASCCLEFTQWSWRFIIDLALGLGALGLTMHGQPTTSSLLGLRTPDFSLEPQTHAEDDRRHGRDQGRAEGAKRKAANLADHHSKRRDQRIVGTWSG